MINDQCSICNDSFFIDHWLLHIEHYFHRIPNNLPNTPKITPPKSPVMPSMATKMMAMPISLYKNRVPPLVPIFSSAHELVPKFSIIHSVLITNSVPRTTPTMPRMYFIEHANYE